MSSGYNEQELSKQTRDLHRALASLQEELEAIDYYQQRMDGTDDPGLKAILAHNRDEEAEHAAMLTEWLRRNSPCLAAALKTYLFTSKPVVEIESAGTPGTGDLGVANMNE